MTPLRSTNSPQEAAYNSAHSKTRSVVERCFGVMKSRFRCLDKSGGTLLYSAEKACKLVTATAVMHNYCVARQLDTPVDPAVMARSAAIQPATQVVQPAGRTVAQLRQSILQQF